MRSARVERQRHPFFVGVRTDRATRPRGVASVPDTFPKTYTEPISYRKPTGQGKEGVY